MEIEILYDWVSDIIWKFREIGYASVKELVLKNNKLVCVMRKSETETVIIRSEDNYLYYSVHFIHRTIGGEQINVMIETVPMCSAGSHVDDMIERSHAVYLHELKNLK